MSESAQNLNQLLREITLMAMLAHAGNTVKNWTVTDLIQQPDNLISNHSVKNH